jgi:hypothetical protein
MMPPRPVQDLQNRVDPRALTEIIFRTAQRGVARQSIGPRP